MYCIMSMHVHMYVYVYGTCIADSAEETVQQQQVQRGAALADGQ